MRFSRLVFLSFVLSFVAACAGPRDLIVLLPDKDGKVGVVTVQNDNGDKVVLDKALASAKVGAAGAEKTEISSDQVSALFKDALAAQPPKPISFILYFRTGGTELTEASKPILKKLFDEVAGRQAVEVQVTGHTDSFGVRKNNDRLALKRAKAVRDMLIARKIKTNRVRAVGRGERELLVPTADGVREGKNRRVEIIVR
ncbi:MAG: OmpA family protein [Alphaproteobacteria bacterium]|nr:OmpA family protein [Alphaproteobacteria bacterium]